AVDLADVWRQLGGLPRHRVAPHRHAVDDLLRAGAADRPEQDHVVLLAQIRLAGDVLGADVAEGHLQLVERHAPPAFGLGADPGVHDGDARQFGWLHVDRGQTLRYL